uniref:Uncharacterized protein n=1 Tax=Clastoptera arizonana TaxID=38151 RepID=A0A1B6C0D2_9HEMI
MLEVKHKIRNSRKSTISSVNNGKNVSLENDVIDLTEISPKKWKKIEEEEETHMIILEIQNDVLNKVFDIVYENYLEKKVNKFIVECSYKAWAHLISMYFIRKDPGEPKGLNVDTWKGDEEPSTSESYAWASNVIPVVNKPCDKHNPLYSFSHYEDTDSTTERSSSSISTELTQESKEKSQPSTINTSMKPIKKQLKSVRNLGTLKLKPQIPQIPLLISNEPRKETLPPPVPLHLKHFPSSRIEVKFAIQPLNKAAAFKAEDSTATNITLTKFVPSCCP